MHAQEKNALISQNFIFKILQVTQTSEELFSFVQFHHEETHHDKNVFYSSCMHTAL
jgi:hypothetical protein